MLSELPKMYRLGVRQCTPMMAHLKHQVPEDFDKEEVLLLGSPLAHLHVITRLSSVRDHCVPANARTSHHCILQKLGLLFVCPPSSSVSFQRGLGLDRKQIRDRRLLFCLLCGNLCHCNSRVVCVTESSVGSSTIIGRASILVSLCRHAEFASCVHSAT